MFLTENFKKLLSASIAFDRSNALGAKPKPLYKQKEQTRKTKKSCMSALFFVSEVFAVAQVKLCYAQ